MTLPQSANRYFDAVAQRPVAQHQLVKSQPALRVLRQLLEALLSEDCITHQRIYVGPSDEHQFRFQVGAEQWRCEGRVAGFGRVRLLEASLQTYVNKLEPLLQSLSMAALAHDKLHNELAQTVRLCQWNQQHLPARLSRRQLGFDTLESALDEGHPYHPCFKARTDFSEADHAAYGPEAGGHFRLHWLAVHRHNLRINLPLDETEFWQQELGARTYDLLLQRLQLLCADNADPELWQQYALLPVHPWQWHNLQTGLLAAVHEKPLDDDQLLYLGEAGDEYFASQSIRTLINVSQPGKAHVKLPMNLVNTSSLRTLEPHSVCSAPALCTWLQQLVAEDEFFQTQAGLVLLPEYAGLLYEGSNPQLAGQLAAIWRTNVSRYLAPDEQAIPFTALSAVEADGRPFIDPWIQQQGLDAWLDDLLHVAVLPVWHMLVGQGIALEAHGQNLILLHKQGRPSRLAVRDFHESVEFVTEYLARPELCPDFAGLNDCYANAAPNEFYWMDGVEALRELYMDTLYVYNLSDLAHLLLTHYGLPESVFWQRLADVLQGYAEAGFISAERIALIGADAQQVKVESLLRRKLRYPDKRECHHWVSNPLSPTFATQ